MIPSKLKNIYLDLCNSNNEHGYYKVKQLHM